MEDLFKKLLYAGVGLAAQTTDKFEKSLDDLVEKGKISDTEAKKIVDEVIEKTETTREDLESRFKTFTEKAGFGKKSEMEELKTRIEELEAQLATAGSTTKKATTAKA